MQQWRIYTYYPLILMIHFYCTSKDNELIKDTAPRMKLTGVVLIQPSNIFNIFYTVKTDSVSPFRRSASLDVIHLHSACEKIHHLC